MLARAAPPTPLPPVALTLAAWAVLAWLASMPMQSLVGALALAVAAWRLLQALRATRPARAAALVLLVPTLLLDPAPFNSLCVTACSMALTAAIGRRNGAMLAWFGLALGLDTQAVLIAPLFVALLINRRVSWRLWGIAPGVAAMAMFVGASSYDALPAPAPNVWAIARDLPWIGDLPLTGLALAATIGTSAAYIAWFSVRPLQGRALAEAALLCALVTAGLAPWTGAQSFLLPGILAVVLALATRSATQVRNALLVQTGLLLALLAPDGATAVGAMPMLLATALLARAVLVPAANDNPLMARASPATH